MDGGGGILSLVQYWIPGYGVYLAQKQLDAAIHGSEGSATRLMRCLIGVIFTPEVPPTIMHVELTRNHPLPGL